MNMVKENKFAGLVTAGAVAVILTVWGLIGWGIYTRQDSYVITQIKKALPQGSFLREIKKLADRGGNIWLVIYIEKGYTIQQRTAQQMESCTGEITGQPITGRYMLALYENNKLINEVIIPPVGSNSFLDLVYKNIRENTSGDYAEADKLKVEQVSLINFSEMTGDGAADEFLLKTSTGGCGAWYGLVAGYDSRSDRAVIYSDWIPRFMPDNMGNFHYLLDCGDHGNKTRIDEDYAFNKDLNKFIKTGEKATVCAA